MGKDEVNVSVCEHVHVVSVLKIFFLTCELYEYKVGEVLKHSQRGIEAGMEFSAMKPTY